MTRALLEQAEKTLANTLYEVEEKWFDASDIRKTLADIRAELSRPAGEPVAWIPPERDVEFHHEHASITAYRTPMAGWTPLYTHPQHSEAEVQEILGSVYREVCVFEETVRQVLGVPLEDK